MDKTFVEKTLRENESEGKKTLRELIDKKEKLDKFLSDPLYDDLYVLHEHANDERADTEVSLFFMDMIIEILPEVAKVRIPTNDGALQRVDEVKYREKVERAIMHYYQEKYK